MSISIAFSRAAKRSRAKLLFFLCLLLSPTIWSSEPNNLSQSHGFTTSQPTQVLGLVAGFQEDAEHRVKLDPPESQFDSGRAIFLHQPVSSLDLRMTRDEVAVFRVKGVRDAVGIGDRFGKEKYLVLAILEDRVFYQSASGYGLIYKNEEGDTVLQPINRAHLPPDVLELAPKPQ